MPVFLHFVLVLRVIVSIIWGAIFTRVGLTIGGSSCMLLLPLKFLFIGGVDFGCLVVATLRFSEDDMVFPIFIARILRGAISLYARNVYFLRPKPR